MGQSSEPSHHYHRPRTNRQDVGRLRPTRRVGTAIGNLMIIISYLSTASLCAIFIPPFAPPPPFEYKIPNVHSQISAWWEKTQLLPPRPSYRPPPSSSAARNCSARRVLVRLGREAHKKYHNSLACPKSGPFPCNICRTRVLHLMQPDRQAGSTLITMLSAGT